jgi:hypothetical protein
LCLTMTKRERASFGNADSRLFGLKKDGSAQKRMNVSLAYKFVATAAMLAEINNACNTLPMDVALPIQQQAVKSVAVFHPSVIGFAGSIATSNWVFQFSGSGQLRFITSTAWRNEHKSQIDYFDTLAGKKAMINTDEAYRIATNCLFNMDVDVVRLEKEKPATVMQQRFLTKDRRETVLPIFNVRWGEWSKAAVDMQLSGDGKVIKLLQDDISYSRRPKELIKNTTELLGISDPEFLNYTDGQKSNLVARSVAVTYPGRATFGNSFHPTNNVSNPIPILTK